MARTIKRAYARYTAEFKAEAVRLASQPGIQVQHVAQSLVIHPFMLSRWKKQCREGVIMAKLVAQSPFKTPWIALAETSRYYNNCYNNAGSETCKR